MSSSMSKTSHYTFFTRKIYVYMYMIIVIVGGFTFSLTRSWVHVFIDSMVGSRFHWFDRFQHVDRFSFSIGVQWVSYFTKLCFKAPPQCVLVPACLRNKSVRRISGHPHFQLCFLMTLTLDCEASNKKVKNAMCKNEKSIIWDFLKHRF